MSDSDFRVEHDSMGELKVPAQAMWGAQTQRAVENFPVSGLTIPRAMIRALALIKACAAKVNADLGLLDGQVAKAVEKAAAQVERGDHDREFPIDIFQTGSGTSSNMNANEVIAHIAEKESGLQVHPNDHVNMGQSSNDVVPTAIHVAAALLLEERLLPALTHLQARIDQKAQSLDDVVTTGRTHLMDAMPIRYSQLMSGWSGQIQEAQQRLNDTAKRLTELAQGGTAVGTGINAHPQFGRRVAAELSKRTGIHFNASDNYFVRLSTQDTAAELSGQLKVLGVSLMKIANDLRWQNSGPLAGLGEISLAALQPGSSIMPGKINPVIPEAVTMVAAQLIGNDATITVGAQAGNFQLNVMLPVIGYNLMQSLDIAANAVRILADKAIPDFAVNRETLQAALARNPILVTALNPVIGYEKGAKIAKRAYQEKRPVLEVAKEMTDLSSEELQRLLDPRRLTEGGLSTKS